MIDHLEIAKDAKLMRFAQRQFQLELEKGREKGRSGWHDPEVCSVAYLRARAWGQFEQGRLESAAVFLMMAAFRQQEEG